MSETIRIIGIDPGLRHTGWGIIGVQGTRLTYVADGTIRPDADASLAERLKQLHDELSEVIGTWQPDEAAVEETFVNKDARATLKLGPGRRCPKAVGTQASNGMRTSVHSPATVGRSAQ